MNCPKSGCKWFDTTQTCNCAGELCKHGMEDFYEETEPEKIKNPILTENEIKVLSVVINKIMNM